MLRNQKDKKQREKSFFYRKTVQLSWQIIHNEHNSFYCFETDVLFCLFQNNKNLSAKLQSTIVQFVFFDSFDFLFNGINVFFDSSPCFPKIAK